MEGPGLLFLARQAETTSLSLKKLCFLLEMQLVIGGDSRLV
jgi:hypothetical protein